MRELVRWFRHWWIALGAGAAGFVILGASWGVSSNFTGVKAVWWEAVLTNVGAAVLLVVPITWITERLSRQVEIVREDVETVREESLVEAAATREDMRRVREETTSTIEGLRQEVASLRGLSEDLTARVAAEAERESSAYRRLGLDGVTPDRADVINALRLARENGVADYRYGPRAELVRGLGDYVQLIYEPNDFAESDLFFGIVRGGGSLGERVPWDEDVSTGDAMFQLIKSLRSEGVNPKFDAEDWFRRISETLVVGASHIERHEVIELCHPQWAVTRSGIAPYPDNPLRGLGPDSIRSEATLMAVRRSPWVDADSLDQAASTWVRIFGDGNPWGSSAPF